ncbi:tRNA pseudouridine synthase B [Tersicoccus solisilvae]|uniref:tRNA pseudouridine synthase B n=1 Tax=Tersicoccus solisilvae TaxID=1882339 RepID=A0ABQ1PQ11_9MICC|nr:tRNA pseudouridine(55) synthase TruB [Tersicoccus solisilvae]GGD00803.1 tRNA pseudouridine synthase B [Tersicoccus solisilvae]
MPAPGDPRESRDGFVLVDKPAGWTSHDVVGRMRRLAGTRRVGHAGTLDPLATGVLVLGINRATKLLTYVVGAPKTYAATIRLGQATVTDDAEGDVTVSAGAAGVTAAAVRGGVAALTGDILQVPSAVSAIKVDGQRAYKRVRDGEDVTLAARPVTVSRFTVEALREATAAVDGPAGDSVPVLDVDVEVDCSSGTYVRALARDLGTALGTGGHLTRLRRLAVGPFRIEDTVTLDQLERDRERDGGLPLIDAGDAAAAVLPSRTVDAAEVAQLAHGRRLAPGPVTGTVAARAQDGTLAAVLQDDGRSARPALVLVQPQGAPAEQPDQLGKPDPTEQPRR